MRLVCSTGLIDARLPLPVQPGERHFFCIPSLANERAARALAFAENGVDDAQQGVGEEGLGQEMLDALPRDLIAHLRLFACRDRHHRCLEATASKAVDQLATGHGRKAQIDDKAMKRPGLARPGALQNVPVRYACKPE